jgi:hypothetical protein
MKEKTRTTSNNKAPEGRPFFGLSDEEVEEIISSTGKNLTPSAIAAISESIGKDAFALGWNEAYMLRELHVILPMIKMASLSQEFNSACPALFDGVLEMLNLVDSDIFGFLFDATFVVSKGVSDESDRVFAIQCVAQIVAFMIAREMERCSLKKGNE